MIQTILVPLDGSDFAERALSISCELAGMLNARLVLVCVAGARSAFAKGLTPEDRQAISEQYAGVKEEEHRLSIAPRMVERTQQQIRAVAEAERYLAGIAVRLSAAGFPVETAVPYATPAEGILTEIELQSADLVVMAAHLPAGWTQRIGGSVAQAVLTHSPAPVLLVPPEQP